MCLSAIRTCNCVISWSFPAFFVLHGKSSQFPVGVRFGDINAHMLNPRITRKVTNAQIQENSWPLSDVEFYKTQPRSDDPHLCRVSKGKYVRGRSSPSPLLLLPLLLSDKAAGPQLDPNKNQECKHVGLEEIFLWLAAVQQNSLLISQNLLFKFVTGGFQLPRWFGAKEK